jgi:hypothetical protein
MSPFTECQHPLNSTTVRGARMISTAGGGTISARR